ncbi:ABC transporter ATP-binding protein [Micrococcus luteus]|uniref:ABC transporter ATP-binding protein n=1 Tax=Micrococcus luteus TaxID=1270 RepID=UPI0006805F6F|nr:ATP-binding cassette domain-containing protein [Micrococcus luteus]TKD54862.1 ATP-binding cassette domain-containing protein [Micrococcus luteus]
MQNTTLRTTPAAPTADGVRSETVVEMKDLRVDYGDFTAVDGIDLEIRRGEFFGLLGTNGAGKTTTIEVMEGHRVPTAGSVRVLQQDPSDRTLRRRVGIMLQESGFAPDLTVRETLALIGRLTRRDDDVDRVLDLVDLRRRRDTRTGQLSGGEKRRLDFATAIFGSPELIFLDEPTTGLDIEARDALWHVVDRLRDEGATILLTTHYLEEAQERADRIALMHSGRIHRQGTVAELTSAFPSTISFRLNGELTVPFEDATTAPGGAVTIPTTNLQEDLYRLLVWSRSRDVELEGLNVGAEGLESLFRALNA